MSEAPQSPPGRWRRFLRLGFGAFFITILGLTAEHQLAEDSVVAEGLDASLELFFVFPDPEYIGQLPVYIEFHQILRSDRELTDSEEERLINLYHRRRTHVDPKTSALISDMYGSLMHRQDLSGTRLRIQRDGDLESERRLSLPNTAWGYSPKNPEEQRLQSLKGLVTNNKRMTDKMLNEVIEIVKLDDSHRVWRYGNDLLQTWRQHGHFENTKDYRDAKWSHERRAMGPLLKMINRPPFRYDPTDDNDASRLSAVRNFIKYQLSLTQDNPGQEMPAEALSDLMIIHQWDEDYRVSVAAWEPVRHGSTIQGLYLLWNEEMHRNKDLLQPPFPWERVSPP